jgi:uncharacterized membrane protein YbhN (UPF0104 family)
MDAIFIILFALLLAWSNSLQITLQAIKEQNIRVRVIAIIVLCLLLAGSIAVYA